MAFGTGVRNASKLDHNKRIAATYLLLRVTSNGTLSLLDNTLCLSKMLMVTLQKNPRYLTLVATEVFFAGAFFLVTPVGLLALVAVAFLGPLFAPVLAVARFLVVVVVVSVTVGKTRGLEFPVSEVQHCSTKLRAELYCKLAAAT